MQIASVFRLLKISAAPALFCVLAVGLLTLYIAADEADAPATVSSLASSEDLFAEAQFSLTIKDLEIAARKGDIPAKLEVARRYGRGQGVERNHARAVAYLQSITQQYWTIEPREGRAFNIPEAFRTLAQYYRDGSLEAGVKPDTAQSERLLRYSASYFGDAASQVDLAKLILNGKAPTKNPLIAAHWLQNASRKGYAPAQALLGNMLWRGEGVKRVAGDGLGLLFVANRSVLPEDRGWVEKMYAAAYAEASVSEVLEANAFIAHESNALRLPLTNDILIAGAAEPKAYEAGLPNTDGKKPDVASAAADSDNRIAKTAAGPEPAALQPLPAGAVRIVPTSDAIAMDIKNGNVPLPQ